ncbi:MAG: energy transducer TonB [Bacteroidales bacterium]|nr:energy transducer TonB [Bacteroidales bacterium]
MKKHKDKLEQNKGMLMQISIIASLLIVLLLFENKTRSAEIYPNTYTEIKLEIEKQNNITDIIPPNPDSNNNNSEVETGNTEKVAEFPGGKDALEQYMKENMQYPPEALKKDIQGRVIVNFTIDKSGKIKDAKVIRSIHPLIDTEALRLIKNMPNWEPAVVNKETVSTKQTLPVMFINKNDHE